MITDTTVLVDFFRGNSKAENFLVNSGEDFYLSRISWMELVYGVRNKRELNILKRQLFNLEIKIVEISEQISQTTGMLFEKYYHSHGLGTMDAFIAATVIESSEKLATHNVKHFQFIKEINLVKPY